MFGYSDGFAIAGVFATAVAAVDAALAPEHRLSPRWDVVFMDIGLSDPLGGIEATRRIKAVMPDTAVVMLTVFENPQTIMAALCAGADGYVLKKSSARALREHAREAIDGGVPMTAEVARATVDLVRRFGASCSPRAPTAPQRPLTNREREVLRLMAEGKTYKEVGVGLDIAIDTVRTHVRRLYRKLEVNNAREAAALAFQHGLI